jgi:glycine cleavage system H protein
MNVPDELRYSRTHQWVRAADGLATIGITDFAQDELGEIVYIDLPAEGATVRAGTSMGEIESVKTVSDLVSPVSGAIEQRNGAAVEKPELVNSDPYGEGWLVRVRLSEGEPHDLLSAAEYRDLTEPSH